jgi:hypothetical protein
MTGMNLLDAMRYVASAGPPDDPRLVQARINLTNAERECPHEALPTDGEFPEGCDCWTQARARGLARDSEQPLCEPSMHFEG